MTRQQIETDYTIEKGIIRSPGKFEGEMLYVPYFWDCFLNGFADADDGNRIQFEITDEDRKQFPELPEDEKTLVLAQRNDGFVCEL